MWGPDLGSGTDGHTSWQKAGGVRGLLALLGTENLKQFPLMDRLGNVTGYKKASVSPGPAVLDAVIEYDAFGREVRSTGPASDTMPFRFSTKYTDPESGLVYYGYRFYDPDRGRWVNRDPIGEKGGMNLYGMVQNNALRYMDYLGLDVQEPPFNGRVCNKCSKDIAVIIDGKYFRLQPGECTDIKKEAFCFADVDGVWINGEFFSVGRRWQALGTFNACVDPYDKEDKKIKPTDRGAPDNDYDPGIEGEELPLFRDHAPYNFLPPWR